MFQVSGFYCRHSWEYMDSNELSIAAVNKGAGRGISIYVYIHINNVYIYIYICINVCIHAWILDVLLFLASALQ